MAVNLIPNGTFEVNANGAINNSNASVARSTAQHQTGVASLLVTSLAAGNWSAAILQLDGATRIAVSPNTKYTMTGWFYSGSGVRAHRIQVSERNSGGGTTATNNSADGALPAGVWTQRTVTFTTTATTVSVIPLLVGTSAAAAGETFYADTLILELTDDTWANIGGERRANIWYR